MSEPLSEKEVTRMLQLVGGDADTPEEKDAAWDALARAALASPCCVSAADQEQVKEVLRAASLISQPGFERLAAMAGAALALLGSNEEDTKEEQ